MLYLSSICMLICSLHYVDSLPCRFLFKDAIIELCLCFSYVQLVIGHLFLFEI